MLSGSERRQKDEAWMRRALRLARRACGLTSPNPMVGAVLARGEECIGEGWHHRAGAPHAEVEALADAARRGHATDGATLYVTLEPCCTHGRTPPCTDAILRARLGRVVVGATDPNPVHAGRGHEILKAAGVEVVGGVLEQECSRLNEAFNHWIQHRTPWVTVKAAMTLDGKIATESGESKWITSASARRHAMRLRLAADAILVGVNTVLADDPSLTLRGVGIAGPAARAGKRLRRIVLDSGGRIPTAAKVATDERAADTIVAVTRKAPAEKLETLARQGVAVWMAPEDGEGRVDRAWLLRRLGGEGVTHLLVEGGGEVNASFLCAGLAHRVAFFYAPLILGGASARKGVAGRGADSLAGTLSLADLEWRRVGPDLLVTARVLPLEEGKAGLGD